MSTLKIKHNIGFFSCFSMRFDDIVRFYNANEYLPDYIDSSEQFAFFKYHPIDLTYLFLKDNHNIYPYDKVDKVLEETVQYIPYSELKLQQLLPFVDKYFTPSDYITSIQRYYENKYKVNYWDTCGVFYRGKEKSVEMSMGTYEEFINKAREILKINPNIRFCVQSDEVEFVDKFLKSVPNSFQIEETVKIKREEYTTAIPFFLPQIARSYFISLFFAATLVMSQCKYLITHSGNCGLWAILYRGNTKNVSQFLIDRWYDL